MSHSMQDANGPTSSPPALQTKRHVAFWLRHLRMLPRPYQSGDTQRITFAFFCLSALDLLDDTLSNESKIPGEEKKSYIEWIYALQCRDGGFTGSPSLPVAYSSGHLAMTYTALLCLALLRDDFSQLDRASLTSLLHALQQPDGSFAPTKDATHECDPRFTFCAFAICWIVNDWSGVDVETACGFLERCRAYDGAYAQGPGQESHGGSTYCVLASLSLAGKVEGDKRLVGWLLARQAQHDEKRDEEGDDNEEEDSSSSNEDGGDGTSTHIPTPLGAFNGRINKPGDSCYSFWCGASLDILSSHSLISKRANISHLLALQTPLGGTLKNIEQPHPDVMHSYLSLAALSLHAGTEDDAEWKAQSGISPTLIRRGRLDPALNVSADTVDWIRTCLHEGK